MKFNDKRILITGSSRGIGKETARMFLNGLSEKSTMAAIAQQYPKQVYRIDKFKVSPSARNEFLQKVSATHEFIQRL